MPVLTPITDCDEACYLSIAKAKKGERRARLKRAWPLVKARYKEYEECAAKLETLSASTVVAPGADDFKHCFDSTTKPLAELAARILKIVPANGSIVCQYCLFGEIDALDHYLPKAMFPEFAVFPRNLVASCSRCNRMKGSRWLHNGTREILSLYFDDVPDEQFLYVDVTFPRGDRAKVGFKLVRPASMKKAVFKRLERQFEVLELFDRYNLFGSEYVSEAVAVTTPKPRAEVAKTFEESAKGLVKLFGVNHFKPILARELAANGEFMAVVEAR